MKIWRPLLRRVAAATAATIGVALLFYAGVHAWPKGLDLLVSAGQTLTLAIWAKVMTSSAKGRALRRNPSKLEEELFYALRESADRQRLNLLGAGAEASNLQITFKLRGSSARVTSSHLMDMCLAHPRVVLIGGAGSGKTVAANVLQFELLRAWEGRSRDRDRQPPPRRQLPVVVSLNQWPSEVPIQDWVADQLAVQCGIDSVQAKSLVAAGRVFPILDGLDEIDGKGTSQNADSALIQLRKWTTVGEPQAFFVVCLDEKWNTDINSSLVGDIMLVKALPLPYSEVLQFVESFARHTTDARGLALFVRSASKDTLPAFLRNPWTLTAAVEAKRTANEWQSIAAQKTTPTWLVEEFVSERIRRFAGESRGILRQRRATKQLKRYASYLSSNQALKREVAGIALPWESLVLHELWPLAGSTRVRAFDLSLALVVSAPGLAWLSLILWTQGSWLARVLLVVLLIGYLALLFKTTTTAWIAPRKVAPTFSFRTRPSRIQVLAALVSTLVAWVLFGPFAALLVAVTVWATSGLAIGAAQTLSREQSPTASSPQTPLRHERRLSLLTAFCAWPLLTLGLARAPLHNLLACAAVAFAYCLLVGMTVASAPWRRYVAFILASPAQWWHRPSPFLTRATQVGLVRTSGIAYQFRRIEIRDDLSQRS